MAQEVITTSRTTVEGNTFHERPVAVDFIQTYLPVYHKAFQNPPAFFDVRSKHYLNYAAQNMMHQNTTLNSATPGTGGPMPFWQAIYPDAAARFHKTAEPTIVKGSKYRIRDAKSWTEVEQQLQSAQEAYLHATGTRGRIRSFRRRAADHSQPAVQTSKLLPNVDMISPVVNSLQNLLEVVHYAARVRQDTQQIRETLEETFGEIDFLFTSFPKDLNVRNAGVDLVAGILETIEQVIAFYLKPLWRKMGSAVFQGDEYEKDITQGIKTIEKRSAALVHQGRNSHVTLSRREADQSRKRDVQLMEVARTTNTTVETVENRVVNIAESVEAMNKRLDMFNEIFSLLHQAESAKVIRNEELLVRPLVQVPSPGINLHDYQPNFAPDGASTKPAALWSYLSMTEIEKDDMLYADTRRERISRIDRGRTEQLLGIGRFRDWLVSPNSSPFLVVGECESLGGVTALTCFCSTLTQALRKKEDFISLAYYCGRHRGDDQDAGCTSVIRSLIAQLLCQYPFRTANVGQEVELGSVRRHESRGLHRLLSWLVAQLSENATLVFIFDGLGYYERNVVIEEMVEVLAHISHMMHDPGLRATVKLLAASPVPVRRMRHFFPESTVLNLASIPDFDVPSSLRTQRQLHSSLDSS